MTTYYGDPTYDARELDRRLVEQFNNSLIDLTSSTTTATLSIDAMNSAYTAIESPYVPEGQAYFISDEARNQLFNPTYTTSTAGTWIVDPSAWTTDTYTSTSSDGTYWTYPLNTAGYTGPITSGYIDTRIIETPKEEDQLQIIPPIRMRTSDRFFLRNWYSNN